jgi:hypothetical protein
LEGLDALERMLSPMRRRFLQGAWLLSACTAAVADERGVPMPAPPRGEPTAGRLAANDACERCHAVIAAEWRSSQHRTAFADAEFTRAFRREPTAFCQSCHAPEADPRAEVSAKAADVGVGCVTCHVPHGSDGAVLARHESGRAEHAVHASADFVRVDGCASCHEFDFASRPGLAMQSTVSEHARSRFADRSCGDCHMREVGEGTQRHTSHAFAASRDPDMLRSAVVADAQRIDDERVRIRLAPGEIGHAFPTGDLFRRLLVVAEAYDEDGDKLADDTRALGRRFVSTSAGARVRALVEDDRVGARAQDDGVVDVELDLGPDADTLEIRWRVIHQRVDFAGHADDAAIAGETIVVSGTLPPQENAP